MHLAFDDMVGGNFAAVRISISNGKDVAAHFVAVSCELWSKLGSRVIGRRIRSHNSLNVGIRVPDGNVPNDFERGVDLKDFM